MTHPGGRAAALVGRSTELDELRGVLGAPARSRLVQVVGPPGVGKSHLLDGLLEQPEAARWQVRRTGISELERELPFAPLVRLLDLVPTSDRPDAARVGELLWSMDASVPGLARLQVAEGVAQAVAAMASEQPLLLVLDDLHWVDEATAAVLDRIAAMPDQVPVLIVTAMRPEVSAHVGALERSCERSGRLARHTLDPLADDDLEALAARTLGAPIGPALQASLRALGGTALLATQLLARAREHLIQLDDGRLDVADAQADIVDVVARQLDALSRAERETLLTACVLGREVDPRRLAIVRDTDEVAVLRDLVPSIQLGLIVEDGDGHALQARHHVVWDAILASLPAAVRAARHRECAMRLDDAGLPPPAWLPHLLRGDWRGVPDVEDRFLRGARAAIGLSAPLAADLLERVIELVGPARRAALREELVNAYQAAGRLDDAEAVLSRLAREPLASLHTEDRDLLAGHWAHAPWRAAGPEVWLERLAELEEAGLSESGRRRAVRTRTFVAAAAWPGREDTDAQVEALASLAAEPDAASLAYGLARVRAVLAEESGDGPAFDEAQAEAVRQRRVAVDHDPFGFPLAAATWSAGPAWRRSAGERQQVLHEALALCDEIGMTDTRPPVLLALVAHSVLGRRWPDAVGPAAELVAFASDGDLGPPSRVLHAPHWTLLAGFLRERGDHRSHRRVLDGLDTVCDRMEREAATAWMLGTGRFVLPHVRDVAALVGAWRSGDRRVASALVDPIVDTMIERSLTTHALAEVVAIVADLGRDDAVARLLGLGTPDPDALVGDRTDRDLDLVLAAASGDLPAIVERWDDVLGSTSLGWWVVDLREPVAELLQRRGMTDRAVELLDRVHADWDRLGASEGVARTRAALRTLGVVRRAPVVQVEDVHGWEAVTEAEWRVVELIVEGLTYREIGERLHLSRRTVETHAANVFRKVDVHSRRDLVDRLRRDAAEGAVPASVGDWVGL